MNLGAHPSITGSCRDAKRRTIEEAHGAPRHTFAVKRHLCNNTLLLQICDGPVKYKNRPKSKFCVQFFQSLKNCGKRSFSVTLNLLRANFELETIMGNTERLAERETLLHRLGSKLNRTINALLRRRNSGQAVPTLGVVFFILS